MSKNNGKPKKPDARKTSRELSLKQREFIANYTDPTKDTFGNATRSAIAAGYSEKTAYHTGYENLRKPQIQNEMIAILDRAGVTREKSADVLAQAMDAETVKMHSVGNEVHVEKLPDYANQLRAVELAGRLRGDFPTNRTIERLALLHIQNTLIVVPGGLPEPEEKAKNVRQLTD